MTNDDQWLLKYKQALAFRNSKLFSVPWHGSHPELRGYCVDLGSPHYLRFYLADTRELVTQLASLTGDGWHILNSLLQEQNWHTIWTLPRGDSDYSKRLGWIKKEFTKHWLTISNIEQPVSEGRKRERRRGIWQPRFREHTIEDEDDFERHFDYIHYNPVKHGYVRCPHEWEWSSFHRWVNRGVYRKDWACWNDGRELDFSDIEDTTGEPETW